MQAYAHSAIRRDIGAGESANVLWIPMDTALAGDVAKQAPTGYFFLTVRGVARVSSTLGAFDLAAGKWLAVHSERLPSLEFEAGALVLALAVDAVLMGRLREHPRTPIFFAGCGEAGREDRRFALRAWRRAIDSKFQPDLALSDAGQAVLLFIGGLHASQALESNRCPGHSCKRQRQVYMRMQGARLKLDGNPDKLIRISDLATESGFSLWYFSKLFHSLYGLSPQRYALETRLRRACELLSGTQMSIAEIGLACGFENPCSFARAFRGNCGVTASMFRSKCHSSLVPIDGGRHSV